MVPIKRLWEIFEVTAVFICAYILMTVRLFHNRETVILASNSPRRRELLNGLGIDFSIEAAEVDETPYSFENPEDFAARMAGAKTEIPAKRHPRAWIIGADTVVTIAGEILGKPGNRLRSLEMLRELNDGIHTVYTAFCLRHQAQDITVSKISRTEVRFNRLPDTVLQAYVRTGEPLDKAGGYGIQGIGSFLVREIAGSCTGVIGLPMGHLVSCLLKYDVIEPV